MLPLRWQCLFGLVDILSITASCSQNHSHAPDTQISCSVYIFSEHFIDVPEPANFMQGDAIHLFCKGVAKSWWRTLFVLVVSESTTPPSLLPITRSPPRTRFRPQTHQCLRWVRQNPLKTLSCRFCTGISRKIAEMRARSSHTRQRKDLGGFLRGSTGKRKVFAGLIAHFLAAELRDPLEL